MGTASFGNIERRKVHGVQRVFAAIHIVVGLVLAVLGALMLTSIPWNAAARHVQTSSWAVTDARILSVTLSEGSQIDARGEHPVSQLVLSVKYDFEVSGEVFTGRRASFEDRADPLDRRLRALYGKLHFARLTGRTVPVAYDPHDPSEAYLDREFDWQPAVWRAGIAFGAVIFGIGLVAGGLRTRN